jgi:hypothetical protein
MRRLLALCDRHDLPGFRPHALGYLGWGLAQGGDLAEGVALMESAIKAFDAMEYTLAIGAHLANLADALRRLGRLDEAKAMSTRAVELVETSGNDVWAAPEILRVDALIEQEIRQDDRHTAAHGLQRAVERAREIGSPVFERRCLLNLVAAAGDPEVVRAAKERLAALSYLDNLPDLVASVMGGAHCSASPAVA